MTPRTHSAVDEIFASASPRGASGVWLPFEGAPLDGAAHPADPADSDGALDHNPRFRRLRGFHSRYLPGERDILLYLPQAYLSEPQRRFPVFYLHDAQNLFDGRTAFIPGHTWQAHAAADRLAAEGRIAPIILAGICHGGSRRMAEYTPSHDTKHGGGDGPLYSRLVVDELKPSLDSHLRTLTGPADTALGGSSLGGLISLWMGLCYPQVFGKLAILSPSLWWDNRALLSSLGRRIPPASRPRLWLDIGTGEGHHHVEDTSALHDQLVTLGWQDGVDMHYQVFPDAPHNEQAWASRFPQVLEFLFPPRT